MLPSQERDIFLTAVFPDDWSHEGSIEYPAGDNDDDSSGDIGEERPFEGTVEATNKSMVIDQQILNMAESKKYCHQVCGSGKTTSEETTGGMVEPKTAGWPQGPCQLDGVSLPFLVEAMSTPRANRYLSTRR